MQIKINDNQTYEQASWMHLAARAAREPQTVVTNVAANPGKLSALLSVHPGGNQKHRTFQCDSLSQDFRDRVKTLWSRHPDWQRVLSVDALELGRTWYQRVRADLPKNDKVHDHAKCGLAVLATNQRQMAMLANNDRVDALVFDWEYRIETVMVADEYEMVVTGVSQRSITELAPPQWTHGQLDMMALEQRLELHLSRPIIPEDYRMRLGCRTSQAADEMLRQIVNSYLRRIGKWRPTYYRDIASDEMTF